MKFIRNHSDPWHTADGEDGPQPHPPARKHTLLTLEQWHAVRETWPAGLAKGVILPNSVDIEDLADELHRLQLIVLQFPKWVDGRAYSQARLLRSRNRYGGEIRATGDVLVDMVPLLKRTGFSSAQLRRDQKIDNAERALNYFIGHYQGDVLQPKPGFARDLEREAGAHAQREKAEHFAGEGI